MSRKIFCSLIWVIGFMVACQPTPPAEPPLYLAIIWHQHQPLYFKDPQTGLYQKPWVRVHAAKDYYDMAAILKSYPEAHATFNLTPTLIRQLDDFAAGAKDLYWATTEIPAHQLNNEQKRFILTRFFDANWDKVIGRFPRYRELLDLRGRDVEPATIARALELFTTQDYRDLQVWFNLAWTDPDFLSQEPLVSLVQKGRDFSEEDKAVVLQKHLEILRQVIPLHRELQDAGQIEVTMTPYAHPILPLIYDTDLAQVAIPDIQLPSQEFSFPQDAIAQVRLGVEFYQQHFGRPPRGMWPAEGSVAQEMVKMVSEAGIRWMASDEEVLAKSLSLDGFTRDSQDTVQQADQLYRPYFVAPREGDPVAILFRDHLISDLVGFRYSGMDGQVAARDLLDRVHAIRERLREEGTPGPNLVTILLDGENAWEYYENDGKEFLHSFYQLLSEDETIRTVTPSEYLELFPDMPRIEQLWAGSWVDHTFSTWIGEGEENRAWDYLFRVRDDLAQYDLYKRRSASQDVLERALLAMYAAEGSDWFWWYGSDQDSGDDLTFDLMFRNTLTEVYRALGDPVPDFLAVPVIPKKPAPATRELGGAFTPIVDGLTSADEWARAAFYAEEQPPLTGMFLGLDAGNLYFRLDSASAWQALADELFIYIAVPRTALSNSFSRYGQASQPKTVLGIPAAHEVRIDLTTGETGLSQAAPEEAWSPIGSLDRIGLAASTLEIGIPLDVLGEMEPGDRLRAVAILADEGRDVAMAPSVGPVEMVLPDLGQTSVLLEAIDPQGDDYGPGSYIYPTDPVFQPQVYDLQRFLVGQDERNLVFTFELYGPIANVWSSPLGLSVQALDVYIDVDGQAGSGARMLLPGRNAAVGAEDAWDYAIWVEGWMQGLYAPDANGQPQKLDVSLKVIVDPAQRKVTIRVPRAALGEDPQSWGYAGLVLSQEGFPSPGVWRIRDVLPQAAQWRFGGGPADVTNYPRIIDLAWPEGAAPSQREILSTYTPSGEADLDSLSPDLFAILPLLRIQ